MNVTAEISCLGKKSGGARASSVVLTGGHVAPSDPNDLHIVPGGPVAGFRGISPRDHLHFGAYHRFDCVSTLTPGRVWARVRNPAGMMDGALVNYHPATGEVQAAGGVPVPNALFRSIAVLLPDEVAASFGAGGEWAYAAVVELHHPGV